MIKLYYGYVNVFLSPTPALEKTASFRKETFFKNKNMEILFFT